MRCSFPQLEEREKRPIAPSRSTTLLPSREEASACADLTSPPGFQALRPAERGRQQPAGQAETVMATILPEPAGRRPRPARRLPVARVAYHPQRPRRVARVGSGSPATAFTSPAAMQDRRPRPARRKPTVLVAQHIVSDSNWRQRSRRRLQSGRRRRPLPARRLPAARAPRRRQR